MIFHGSRGLRRARQCERTLEGRTGFLTGPPLERRALEVSEPETTTAGRGRLGRARQDGDFAAEHGSRRSGHAPPIHRQCRPLTGGAPAVVPRRRPQGTMQPALRCCHLIPRAEACHSHRRPRLLCRRHFIRYLVRAFLNSMQVG